MTSMDDLRRAARWYVASVVLLWVSIIVLGAFGYVTNSHRASEGQKAHAALCVFQQDLRDRVRGQIDFLRERPNGISGISPSQILNSIHMEQRTLKSLDDLNCN